VTNRPRSPKAHRHFFAIIDKAFQNWPDTHPFQPDSAEHLRAWLEVKAGHRDIILADPSGPMVEFIKAVLKRIEDADIGFRYGFPAVKGDMIAVAFPRSISWSTLSQEEFSPIANEIYAILEDIIGVDTATLIEKTKETI